MEQELARQLIRQLKILNRWVTFFGLIFLVCLIIAGILLYRLVTFVQDTQAQLSETQQKAQETLNLKKQLCDSAEARTFIKNSSLCN